MPTFSGTAFVPAGQPAHTVFSGSSSRNVSWVGSRRACFSEEDPSSLPHQGARLDAEFPGFTTHGDASGGVGDYRQHCYWLAPLLGTTLLLHRGEKGIEIYVERA
jgi:hypothetical protein